MSDSDGSDIASPTEAGLGSGAPEACRSAAQEFAYPSVDPGLPSLSIDQLLSAHSELIARTKICYGAPSEAFEREVMTVVRRYAAFVHLLPATPANYFNEPGGLLRLGLETAFYALQGTDAHIFSGRATIAVRRQLEPRWRLATYIGGLCAEIHRTVSQLVVTDRSGAEWPSYMQGLQPWLAETAVPRYYLKWLPNAPENAAYSLFALPLVVPAATLQHLAQGNKVVLPHLMASLARMPLAREHNILDELVRRSAALVIDRFLQASANRFGKPILGSHLERYLVDALRRLVASHAAWAPNAARSRIWYGSDGMFIVWPNGAADVRKLLEEDQLPGIPKSPQTMLEILLGAGILQVQQDGGAVWRIRPPDAKNDMEAVKLTDPAIVLAGVEHRPDPLAHALQHRANDGGGMVPPSPSQASRPERPTSLRDSELQRRRPAGTADSAVAPPQGGEKQLSLRIDDDPASSTDEAQVASLPQSPAGVATVASTCLVAPMRLAPRVRAALEDILGNLPATCVPGGVQRSAQGLFVPFAEFERRQVEPSQALRELSDAGMLLPAASSNAEAAERAVQAPANLGLTVAAAFISGWQAGR
jgi:conjugal transfer pilus assembly protein TraI